MATLSDGDWRLIERAYCHSTEPIEAIAERFGICPATISNRRTRCGWPPRRPGAITRPRVTAGDRRSTHDALVVRFYALITLKLEQLEDAMAQPGERAPGDHERDTRAIGSLVRSYEKVHGLDRGSGDDVDNADDRAASADADADADAEAIRRELAQEIVRLRHAGTGNT